MIARKKSYYRGPWVDLTQYDAVIRKGYAEHKSQRQIAEEYGIQQEYIRVRAKQLGLAFKIGARLHPNYKCREDFIIAGYRSGKASTKIAVELGVSQGTVMRYAERLGLKFSDRSSEGHGVKRKTGTLTEKYGLAD